MSRKISIKDKKRWLEIFEAGRTEAQIARIEKRDPRTIARGIEEAIKARRITNIEEDMLRKALFDHQAQLLGVLNEIGSVLVMPSSNLELREEKDSALADIPISGGLVKTISEDQMILEIGVEKKLEWELLQEHLKQDKIWDYIEKWRSTLLAYVVAELRFKHLVKAKLVKETDLRQLKFKGSQHFEDLLQEFVELLYDVTTQKILGIQNATDVRSVIDRTLGSDNDTAESREKIVSIFTSLPQTPEASEVKRTYGELAEITKTAKREIDELLLLNLVTGRCRVCRRLGR